MQLMKLPPVIITKNNNVDCSLVDVKTKIKAG